MKLRPGISAVLGLAGLAPAAEQSFRGRRRVAFATRKTEVKPESAARGRAAADKLVATLRADTTHPATAFYGLCSI